MNRGDALDLSNIHYVFLDRDGVLNHKPAEGKYITCVEELALLPQAEEAVAELNRAGRKVIVVTNQRGIALGLYSQEDLARIHDEMRRRLALRGAHVDGIYVCPHQDGSCGCRKPLTGLFEQAFRDFPNATPANSVMIGDSLRDIEAGNRLGMRTVLIVNGGTDRSPRSDQAAALADFTATSLATFVNRSLGAPNT